MKILIYGLGISGKATLKHALKQNFDTYVMNSGNVEGWYTKDLGVPKEHCLTEEDFMEVDKVILSPGIPRSSKQVQKFLKSGASVITDIEYMFDFFKGQIIAVTGTNGKTTTSDMISSFLKQQGKSVFLGGNIGIAAAEYNNEDYIVLEMSSYQLESIKNFRADISLITNIFPNHLERYNNTFDEYKKAKLNLIANTKGHDLIIINKNINSLKSISNQYFIEIDPLKQQAFSRTFDLNNTNVIGDHNIENFLFAYTALKNLDFKFKHSDFQRFIESYPGVEHRIEFVGKFNHLAIYNDSKSTNIKATEIALDAFKDSVYLVLGGVDKKISIAENMKRYSNIKQFLLLGESNDFLEMDLKGLPIVTFSTLEKLVDYSTSLKGTLLFSPAHQSFDLFKNFEDRGRQFKELVAKKFS